MAEGQTLRVVPGERFRHDRFLDLSWKPDPARGEKYADAPKHVMVITRTTKNLVYYSDGPGRAPWRMARAEFVERFGTRGCD